MSKGMKILSGLVLILSILLAGYMMLNHMGLIEGLNFGAGAYYYADIPEFDRFVNGELAYESPVSFWVILILFLIWGYVVYSFWVWLEKRDKRR